MRDRLSYAFSLPPSDDDLASSEAGGGAPTQHRLSQLASGPRNGTSTKWYAAAAAAQLMRTYGTNSHWRMPVATVTYGKLGEGVTIVGPRATGGHCKPRTHQPRTYRYQYRMDSCKQYLWTARRAAW